MLETGRGALPAEAAGWLESAPGAEAVIRKRLQLLDGRRNVLVDLPVLATCGTGCP